VGPRARGLLDAVVQFLTQRPRLRLGAGKINRKRVLPRLHPGAWLLLGLAIVPVRGMAMTVQFDFSFDSSGLFAPGGIARNLLTTAGEYFSDLLTDSLSAISSAGPNQFNAAVFNPGGTPNPCTSGNPAMINLPGYSVAADAVVIFVAGRGDLSSLGCGGPGGYSASGSSAFLDLVERRGQPAPTEGAGATEFAPWGGAIAFSTTANWYFDPDPATSEPFSGSDFYSTALHELGHVLGLGTAAAWFNLIQGGVFGGSAVVAASGAPAPVTTDGTHWRAGTQSTVNGQAQEAAMDPTLSNGTRKLMTTLDVAALDDIGWSVQDAALAPTRVPMMANWSLALLGLGLLSLARPVMRAPADLDAGSAADVRRPSWPRLPGLAADD